MLSKLKAFIILILLFFSLLFAIPANATNSWQKYPLNPILAPSSGWDAQHIQSPFIIKVNNVYKMWYVGNGGFGWKLGYASSLNGIQNWNKSTQPIFQPGSNDGWEKEDTDPVLIATNSSSFQMWYTSMNTEHWPSGLDRFRTRYAFSTDGINWIRNDGWVMFGNAGKWDSGGTNRSRSVVFVDGLYKMWYAGTNENDIGSNPYWRIGYATSLDGINWTKQNGGNPVIEPTVPWELNNVSFPTVIVFNNIYHMWYGAGSRDAPTQIVYAYSTDGINWIKPADRNPVLTTSTGTFDQRAITVTSILNEDNQLKMWYSGFDGGEWAIGYATASADIIGPTPTPTPTPTPPPSTKIVIVPGLGASWNKDAILNCKLNNYNGKWKLAFYAEQYYKPLYTVLSDEGYAVRPYYYDWRKNVPSHANALNNFIKTNATPEERINLLGHSMGGLLARSYLERVTNQNRLSKFLSIGAPHRGASYSYPAWSGGELWEKNLLIKIAMTLALKRCDYYENPRKNIQKFFPSTQNLLRIDDYLRNNTTGQLKSVASMSAQNNWLPTPNFTPPFYGVTVGSLSGVDQQTLDVIRVKKRSAIDAMLGNWADGRPVSREYSYSGDGTVLAHSSDIPGSIIKHISQDHTDLIHSNEGYEAILQFLNPSVSFKPVSDALLQKPTSAIIIIADPATAEASSPDGVTLSSDEGTLAIYNPKSGNYKLTLNPKSSATHVIIAQFLEDGRVLWKEYTLTGTATIQKTLQFNPLNPQEDALK